MTIFDQIAELEELINASVRNTSFDGVSTTFDLDTARRRLTELKQQQIGKTWPMASTIRLSSGFPE